MHPFGAKESFDSVVKVDPSPEVGLAPDIGPRCRLKMIRVVGSFGHSFSNACAMSHEGARDPSAMLLGLILQVHLNADYTQFDSPRRCSLSLSWATAYGCHILPFDYSAGD